MFKQAFAKCKSLEKYFFKADKSKNQIAYVKLKHQFRTILAFSILPVLFGILLLIVTQVFPPMPILLFVSVLIGFRNASYSCIRGLIFVLAIVLPTVCPTTSLVLATPSAMLYANTQLLIQTQSENLMAIHWVLQAIEFYFYGMDYMTRKIKSMTVEELVLSTKGAMIYTFLLSFVNLICMRIFYSQFSRLLKKINTLKENLSEVNNQLNDQNLKLQSNLEMKDGFIHTFSYELKNALNGLLGNLSLAYDIARDAQSIQFLSSAKVCGEVLKNFVQNIIDSGKLETGNLEVSSERKDVMNFMQIVWNICGRIIQNKRLQGYLEVEKNVPRFLDLDEQRMIQIILNLVSNAVKFTDKGHVRLRISWKTVSTPRCQPNSIKKRESQTSNNRPEIADEEVEETALFGDIREFPETIEGSPSNKEDDHLVTEYQKKFMTGSIFYQLNSAKWNWDHQEVLPSNLPEGSKGILKIQVLDSGCGMTSEVQSRLFQKFSQINQAAGQRKAGTGLGLWICKKIAHRLDGDITTRSTVELGSVFELTIRTKVSQIPNKTHGFRPQLSQSRISSSTISSLDTRAPNNLSVLIADDDSFNIELMKNCLKKFGISYLCAHDGEETVSLFKARYQEICFVITENFMPKKTGTEAALEIANFLEDKKLPKLPILCISGDLKVSVGERGITSVIRKPINFDRLKEELMVVYPLLT